jgi:CRP/FNR family transcriptional regulator, cyclic AMP receptor protein
MTLSDTIGYVASGLVLAAFCMKEIVPLRLVALCSNVAFLVYGVDMGLMPIWLLHGLLLPMNSLRLAQVLLERRPSGHAAARAHRSLPIEPVLQHADRKAGRVSSRASAHATRRLSPVLGSEGFRTVRTSSALPPQSGN